tara:strand:+ start:666 stop:824 length:159 start_codon:yes stop_codon:yes gene_type:complete
LLVLWLATDSEDGEGTMTVKWQPIYQCPNGCDKFFGSTVALNWHLQEHKETP